MSMLETGGLYLFTSAIHVTLTVFVFWRLSQGAPVPTEEQVGFGDALAAATTVSPVFDAELPAAQAEDEVATGDESAPGAEEGPPQ
jgi:hypothetical protein